MEKTALFKKLQIREGMSCALFNAPRETLPLFADLDEKGGVLDGAIVFLKFAADIPSVLPGVLGRLKPDGLLWLAFPKKSSGLASDLSRDVLWKLVEPYGLRPVSNVAITEVWSALRFRPGKWENPPL